MMHAKGTAAPSHGDTTMVVSRWAKLWSNGDLAGADNVFALNLHDHRAPPAHDIEGIEAEKHFIMLVRAAFPDLEVTIEDMVVEGDRVAARVLHHGTHRGSFMGIEATGRSVRYEGTVIFRIVDNRIAERWGTVDLFGILWQLGDPTMVPAGNDVAAVFQRPHQPLDSDGILPIQS